MLPRRGESAQARRSIIMLYKKNWEREGERNSPPKKEFFFCFFFLFFTPILYRIKKKNKQVRLDGTDKRRAETFSNHHKNKRKFWAERFVLEMFWLLWLNVAQLWLFFFRFSYSALFLWYINYVVSVRGLFSLPKVWLRRERAQNWLKFFRLARPLPLPDAGFDVRFFSL